MIAWTPLRAVLWLALTPVVARADGTDPTGGTSVLAPLSGHASEIHRYSLFVLAITGAIFLVVFTLLAIAVVRFPSAIELLILDVGLLLTLYAGWRLAGQLSGDRRLHLFAPAAVVASVWAAAAWILLQPMAIRGMLH